MPTVKRRKPPTSVTLLPEIRARAERLQAALGYANFSELVAALVREEYERRNGPVRFSSPAPPDPQAHSDSVLNDAQAQVRSGGAGRSGGSTSSGSGGRQ